jgi:hypothetical protein
MARGLVLILLTGALLIPGSGCPGRCRGLLFKNGINKMHERFPTFSTAQIEHMVEQATALGEGFTRELTEDVARWCDSARHELVECTSPVTDLRSLRSELDAIDHCLGIVERRRAEIRSAMTPSDQGYLR